MLVPGVTFQIPGLSMRSLKHIVSAIQSADSEIGKVESVRIVDKSPSVGVFGRKWTFLRRGVIYDKWRKSSSAR